MSNIESRLIEQVVRGWRDKLVNLSARNRLLNFREGQRNTLALVEPSLKELLSRVLAGRSLNIVSLEDERSEQAISLNDSSAEGDSEVSNLFEQFSPIERVRNASNLLGSPKPSADIQKSLRWLLDSQNTVFLDTGLSIVYLAVGKLEWRDWEAENKVYQSPLVLIPLELKATSRRSPVSLQLRDDEISVNRALSLKFSTLDIALPSLTETSADAILTYLDLVARLVSGHKGWSVERVCSISYFSFHKEAMYQDLEDHMDSVLASELVRALATSGTDYASDAFLFDPTDEREIDQSDQPEEALQVLDADASQRAAIIAARQGKSFVLEGPPGTGKSQTIANIIATQIADGRSVLFVSEKIAALDVVKNRLDEVGLGSYLLELHSSKAKRSVVAQDLAKALHKHPTARSTFTRVEKQKLKRQREELSAYAESVNSVENQLGLSVHDVIGEVALRAKLPAVPPANFDPARLTAESLADILDAARRLAHAWRPAAEKDRFVWKGSLKTVHPQREILEAIAALEDLKTVAEPYEDLTEQLGWSSPTGIRLLVPLLETARHRPDSVNIGFLTRDQWPETVSAADRLKAALASCSEAEERLATTAGELWRRITIDQPLQRAKAAVHTLAKARPACTILEGFTVDDLEKISATMQDSLGDLETITEISSSIADALGLLSPRQASESEDLLEVFSKASGRHRPEASWFRTDVDREVEIALETLRSLHEQRAEARDAASKEFRPVILEVDPRELHIRFSNQHTGLRKLSSASRADKKTVSDACQAGVSAKEAIPALYKAVAWQEAEEELGEAIDRYAALLGSRYVGDDTDWDALGLALQNAREIVQKARASALEKLAQAASHGSQVDLSLKERATALQERLRSLSTRYDELKPLTKIENLQEQSWENQQFWLSHAIEAIDDMQVTLREFDSNLNCSVTVGHALGIESAAKDLAAAREALRITWDETCSFFEEFSDPWSIDIENLNLQIEYATTVRTLATTSPREDTVSSQSVSLSSSMAHRIVTADFPESLESALRSWIHHRDTVLNFFDPLSQIDLLDWFDSWESANDFLAMLADDDSGPNEWHAFRKALTDLEAWGLQETIDALSAAECSADQVVDVLKREVLRVWIDEQLENDPLRNSGWSADRDSLVREFAAGDRNLIANAVADIVESANSQRPTANVGASKIIDSESQKKNRHMPIRELLDKTAVVSQKLKPVFMMSPLAVSQFLSSSLRFDLVIFDEASQVLPEDAINCIYRASQLIIAGDDNQLPPTPFFETDNQTNQEDLVDEYASAQDFESILKIAKGSGAFTTIRLKWHYRSRHESLITFSNQRFYSGELITFPSTMSMGPDVGVEFFHVPNGVYARGGAKNNFVEARFVAQRVAHHYATRPQMSLGVVALSQSQKEAIEAAIDELRDNTPGLDDKIDKSRLDGFFVKNLESVQGDERDVMIMSIGYGPDEHGKFTMNFGPMNREGGWRRLNVAVTRARFRNEIVASFEPSRISESTQKSLQVLRAYLDYSQRGLAALAMDDTFSLGDAESPFEESVHAWLISEGYSVVTQVGTSGYRIDMAIQRPGSPGQFVLGVECDGAAYHSSRAARDRDRLREEVLTRLGWRLHRIWGTSWYRNREAEQLRLRDAINDAISRPQSTILPGGARTHDVRGAEVDEVDIDINALPDWVLPYKVASPAAPPRTVKPTASDAVPYMYKTLNAVITEEGPIHHDLLVQRLKETWGIVKVTPTIQQNIDKAIVRVSKLRNGDFFLVNSNEEVFDTRKHSSTTRRGISHVYRREIEDTAWRITRDAVQIEHDDLVVTTARYLGFTRVSSEIRNHIGLVVEGLRSQGYLVGDPSSMMWSETPA